MTVSPWPAALMFATLIALLVLLAIAVNPAPFDLLCDAIWDWLANQYWRTRFHMSCWWWDLVDWIEARLS